VAALSFMGAMRPRTITRANEEKRKVYQNLQHRSPSTAYSVPRGASPAVAWTVLEGAALVIHATGKALAMAEGLKTKHAVKLVDPLLRNADDADRATCLPANPRSIPGCSRPCRS
jgi:hypothetical protein